MCNARWVVIYREVVVEPPRDILCAMLEAEATLDRKAGIVSWFMLINGLDCLSCVYLACWVNHLGVNGRDGWWEGVFN